MMTLARVLSRQTLALAKPSRGVFSNINLRYLWSIPEFPNALEGTEPHMSLIETAFQRILLDQYARYPLIQVEDIYKLIHQAALGSEHAVRNKESARIRLAQEIAELGKVPIDPLMEEISPEDEIMRVNLRPYVLARSDPEILLTAFLRTANEYQGEVKRLIEYETYAERMAESGLIPVTQTELHTFFADLGQKGFPPIHHSINYEHAYFPAYRVVALKFL